MSPQEFTAEIHHEDGSYWAEIRELPGCFASGDSIDELREALQEAISLYLHDVPDAGRILEFGPTQPLDVGEIRVLVGA